MIIIANQLQQQSHGKTIIHITLQLETNIKRAGKCKCSGPGDARPHSASAGPGRC